ncbi:MAG TPA: RDD family protein [Longimicrobium sp.]|nr:RDD family protein [Longimicrobium sp.]
MAHAQAQPPGIDPRRVITAESFHVAPHLLGLPLASPSRRLAAILLDLLCVAIVANLGGKILFALAMAFAFFWFAGKRLGSQGGFFSSSVRVIFRCVGALMLFIGCMALWSEIKPRIAGNHDDDDGDERPVSAASATGQPGQKPRSSLPMGSLVRGGLALHAVHTAKDSAGAHAATLRAVRQGRRMGMSASQIRGALLEDSAELSREVNAGIRAALPPPDPLPGAQGDSAGGAAVPADPDSLAAAYVTAVRGGDSARADALRPKLASTFSRDSLDELHDRVNELEREKGDIQREKERLEKRGLLATLLEWLDDLGIGFGWTALYFTFFTAMMKGQTPAKKLFGIRVLRLDGLPMTLWASFERYGGYAAGLFTGLTGYMQVWWDRNRQAVQDKISETVVIRDHGLPLPVAGPRPAPHPFSPFGPPPPQGPGPYGPQGPYGQGPYGPRGPQDPPAAPPYPPRPPAGVGTP